MRLLIAICLLAASSTVAQAPKSDRLQWYTGSTPEILITCESDSDKTQDRSHWWRVKNCHPPADEATLTKIINIQGEQMDAVGHCGKWGPWVLDNEGNIMGRYKNPACPGEVSDGRYGKPDPPRSLHVLLLKRNGKFGNWYWKKDAEEKP